VTAKDLRARLWPANLAGRVFLIVIAGLVIAHVASYFFFDMERTRAIDRFAAAEIAARIADAARVPAGTFSTPQRDEGPGPWRHRIRWRDVDSLGEPPADGEQPSSGFTAELRRLLLESYGDDLVVWLAVHQAPQRAPGATSNAPPRPPPGAMPGSGPGMLPGPGFERPRFLTVALKFPDGRLAIAEAPLLQPAHGIPREAWAAIVLIFVVTALFTLAAVRLAVQPVRMLGDAADRLSRNIEEPPLPEKGAADIRAAARAFNRMQDRLRRHVNSRTLAFAAMSHDIRTPLTRLRLKLESLDDASRDSLGSDLSEIESISKSALEMTKELAPDESIAPVDVDALVRRLAADYETLGTKIPVTGASPRVKARPAALRRALGNLVDNAIKYGRDVTIALGESRDHAVIAVEDRGPGIPAADLEKVVYPFYRLEVSRNRGTGGAGLGLAIAKDIVEGQGGELLLANREGGGLTVTVRLPR
jgi:signal transduction histidine kinase